MEISINEVILLDIICGLLMQHAGARFSSEKAVDINYPRIDSSFLSANEDAIRILKNYKLLLIDEEGERINLPRLQRLQNKYKNREDIILLDDIG